MDASSSSKVFILIITVWSGFFIAGLSGLSEKDVNLVLKSPIKEGDDLKMQCLFTLPKNTSIYTVKWYKGSMEIFRYIPKTRPEKTTFPLNPDMIVDERHSDLNNLLLKGVRGYMTGNISCEVTPDPPGRMVTKIALLLVVVPPRHKPQLETSLGKFDHNLNVYQKLTANCTSAPSKPAVNLTFFINDNPIQSEERGVTITSHPEVKVDDNFETRNSELELILQQSHFVDGKIRIKCSASLFQLYEESSDEFSGEVVRPKPQKQQNSFFGGPKGGSTTVNLDMLIPFISTFMNLVLLSM